MIDYDTETVFQQTRYTDVSLLGAGNDRKLKTSAESYLAELT